MSLTFRHFILEGIRLRTLAVDLWSSSPLSLLNTLPADSTADRRLPACRYSLLRYGTAAQCACAATPRSSLTCCCCCMSMCTVFMQTVLIYRQRRLHLFPQTVKTVELSCVEVDRMLLGCFLCRASFWKCSCLLLLILVQQSACLSPFSDD